MCDDGMLYTDALLGQVVALWRERSRIDDTVLVVLADHGEFTDEHHSFGHNSLVTEEALHSLGEAAVPEVDDAAAELVRDLGYVG